MSIGLNNMADSLERAVHPSFDHGGEIVKVPENIVADVQAVVEGYLARNYADLLGSQQLRPKEPTYIGRKVMFEELGRRHDGLEIEKIIFFYITFVAMWL